MTIKEVQLLTGISKANIRFYEAEGLIMPERMDNGYRTYNESHVDTLKRIRLLRALEVPIDTLRALSHGTATLPDALASTREQFANRHQQLALAEAVMDKILRNGEQYDSLNVDAYIRMLEQAEIPELTQDVNPKLNLPWRRFWARMLDFAIYHLILFLLFPGLFRNPVWSLVRFLLDLALFVTAESLLLAFLGTTPGKALFGISVTDLNGKRLTLKAALDRTLLVTQHGLGFNIPFLTQYKQWESLKALENGQELAWEQESEVNFRDSANWRYLLFFILFIPLTLYPMMNRAESVTPEKEDSPIYAGPNPLRYDYQVEEVLYAIDENYETRDLPILVFSNGQLTFSYMGSNKIGTFRDESEVIGTFGYVPPANDPDAGVWELSPGSATEDLYQFRVEADGSCVLDHYTNMELQWTWKLSRVDMLDIELKNEYTKTYLTPRWCKAGAFKTELAEEIGIRLPYATTMTLIFDENKPGEITITEELFVNGKATLREHTAAADEYGLLSFDLIPPEIPGASHSIFRIPYNGGEYIVCFTYEVDTK